MKRIMGLICLLLLIGCSANGKESPIFESYNSEMFTLTEDDLIPNLFNCSEYVNRDYENNSLTIVDTTLVFGCILKEFHNKTPELTDEILEKYDIIVEWKGFKIT